MAEQFDLFIGTPGPVAVPPAPAPAVPGARQGAAAAEPRLILGDSFEVLATMASESIDAIVTDPPYGLEFMGKQWDAFRVDPRAARWSAEKSGGAGAGFGTGMHGSPLPAFGRRRTTSTCRTCGKRDAFRNPHGCGEAAEWVTIPVDLVPMEMRAFQNWCSAWGAEAYRVLKPGGHLVAFGGPRTHHRLWVGLEDAGFEIRDCLMWLYGSGFPKSLDVSKAIDAMVGAERAVLRPGAQLSRDGSTYNSGLNVSGPRKITAPATAEAVKWAGWGTGLKPAWEPIVLARKLPDGTVAENVLKWGVGGLHIDACRIPGVKPYREPAASDERNPVIFSTRSGVGPGESAIGRWPANLLLDEAAAAMLDEQVGELHGPGNLRLRGDMPPEEQYQAPDPGWVFQRPGANLPAVIYDRGGFPSRFFYTGKASRAEREDGLRDLEPHTREDVTGREPDSPGANHPRASMTREGEIRNIHPTVKPVDLMRWLLRLVVPPGGVVVDPFVGSGTTLVAAWEEGLAVVGIEREPEYHRIAAGRLAEAMRQGRLF